MKYRIMTVAKQNPNNASFYEFYKKKDDEGFMRIYETESKSELAEEVERLLLKLSKTEFIIVSVLLYNLITDIDSSEPEPEPDPTPEPEP